MKRAFNVNRQVFAPVWSDLSINRSDIVQSWPSLSFFGTFPCNPNENRAEPLISAPWPAVSEVPNWSPWAPKGSGHHFLMLPLPVGPKWKDQYDYNSLFFTSATSQCRLWQLWRGTLCDLHVSETEALMPLNDMHSKQFKVQCLLSVLSPCPAFHRRHWS